jgi:nucleotide-binding universal stress UspA family protein
MKQEKMSKILIALDYDKTAQKVADTGYLLGKTMGAEMVLLHVLTDPVYYSTTEYSPIMGFSGYMDSMPIQFESIEELQKAAQHFLDKTKKHLGDNDIKTIVRDGEVPHAILKVAHEIHADIIVLGSHSRKWLENIIMGSATEKVLHDTKIPLFIVPTKKHTS